MAGLTRAYLDHNATTPLCEPARVALVRAFGHVGNASSVHAEGRAARGLIEQARARVAALAGVDGRAVIFTGGGTEANNLALCPGLRRAGDQAGVARLIVSAGEHASVLNGHRFAPAQVDVLPVDDKGVADLSALEALLDDADAAGERVLLSLQRANSETGVLQPVAAAAAMVHARDGFVHCDAVQAFGKIDVSLPALDGDLVTLSAHKMGGPQGVGALALGDDIVLGDRLVRGGGQEHARRAGTENLPGIVGFGAAAAICGDFSPAGSIAALRDGLENAIAQIAPGAVFFARGAARLPNTSNFAVPGLNAETAVIALDLAGVAVSSGSACSSGKVGASHVLKAMGVADEVAGGALRVSLGRQTTRAEIDLFLQAFAPLAGKAGARNAA